MGFDYDDNEQSFEPAASHNDPFVLTGRTGAGFKITGVDDCAKAFSNANSHKKFTSIFLVHFNQKNSKPNPPEPRHNFFSFV